MNVVDALGIVRLMLDNGISKEDAIANPVIPIEFREEIRRQLSLEQTFIMKPAVVLTNSSRRGDWLADFDRSAWFFWNNLRNYLLGHKDLPIASVDTLDEASDRILQQLPDPHLDSFDIKGLVLGYVQSGKTSNYTALIAKAVDVGYRLIIVLSGIDNGLRRQTQIRLDRELVGVSENGGYCVPLPPVGKQWHQFTNEGMNGDFSAGHANVAALQGTQPVLLVMKKNAAVLRRLLSWLETAPGNILDPLPAMIIDDEADLASIDTRGDYLQEVVDDLPSDYEEPSIINGLIRRLLEKFKKRAYVAYTATPFANVLIPYDNVDAQGLPDLYPKDFIIDLPKPEGYFGAEEMFGRFDNESEAKVGGSESVILLPPSDVDQIFDESDIPNTLEEAILAFVVACSARARRGQEDKPATMLIHVSHLVEKQMMVFNKVQEAFTRLKNTWRYLRSLNLEQRLEEIWEYEYQLKMSPDNPEQGLPFVDIKPYINKAFESIKVKAVNYKTGDFLNYEDEPEMKVIAIGGNRLSRGLTLEGLVTSYFFRPTKMYDTLMQMGRWFGFRKGYEDLIRIYMTEELASCYSDLARVEYEIRQDILLYEAQNVTPSELGLKIAKHPSLLVTSKLKQRFARSIQIKQSYSGQVLQTFRFPFRDPAKLTELLKNNIIATKSFFRKLGLPDSSNNKPLWRDIHPDLILNYLETYKIDPDVRNIYMPLVCKYIRSQNAESELTNWTVALLGRDSIDQKLSSIDLGFGFEVPMISRTRLKSDTDSLGVITSPRDEKLDLNTEELIKFEEYRTENPKIGVNPTARMVRDSKRGFLLIYPVSRFSGYEAMTESNRMKIYEDPHKVDAHDVICLALSFPKAINDKGIEGEYLVGTVPWSEYGIN